jgi:hypothetical protein
MGDRLTQIASVTRDTRAGRDGPDDSEQNRERRPDEGEDQATKRALAVP